MLVVSHNVLGSIGFRDFFILAPVFYEVIEFKKSWQKVWYGRRETINLFSYFLFPIFLSSEFSANFTPHTHTPSKISYAELAGLELYTVYGPQIPLMEIRAHCFLQVIPYYFWKDVLYWLSSRAEARIAYSGNDWQGFTAFLFPSLRLQNKNDGAVRIDSAILETPLMDPWYGTLKRKADACDVASN